MTSPGDAAATSRDTTNQRIYPASDLETRDVPAIDPPRPVPFGDPIADVTKGWTR